MLGPPIRNFRTPAKAKYVLHIRIETVVDKIIMYDIRSTTVTLLALGLGAGGGGGRALPVSNATEPY